MSMTRIKEFVEVPVHSSTHVQYRIVLTRGGFKWTIRRRYTEFYECFQKLWGSKTSASHGGMGHEVDQKDGPPPKRKRSRGLEDLLPAFPPKDTVFQRVFSSKEARRKFFNERRRQLYEFSEYVLSNQLLYTQLEVQELFAIKDFPQPEPPESVRIRPTKTSGKLAIKICIDSGSKLQADAINIIAKPNPDVTAPAKSLHIQIPLRRQTKSRSTPPTPMKPLKHTSDSNENADMKLTNSNDVGLAESVQGSSILDSVDGANAIHVANTVADISSTPGTPSVGSSDDLFGSRYGTHSDPPARSQKDPRIDCPVDPFLGRRLGRPFDHLEWEAIRLSGSALDERCNSNASSSDALEGYVLMEDDPSLAKDFASDSPNDDSFNPAIVMVELDLTPQVTYTVFVTTEFATMKSPPITVTAYAPVVDQQGRVVDLQGQIIVSPTTSPREKRFYKQDDQVISSFQTEDLDASQDASMMTEETECLETSMQKAGDLKKQPHLSEINLVEETPAVLEETAKHVEETPAIEPGSEAISPEKDAEVNVSERNPLDEETVESIVIEDNNQDLTEGVTLTATEENPLVEDLQKLPQEQVSAENPSAQERVLEENLIAENVAEGTVLEEVRQQESKTEEDAKTGDFAPDDSSQTTAVANTAVEKKWLEEDFPSKDTVKETCSTPSLDEDKLVEQALNVLERSTTNLNKTKNLNTKSLAKIEDSFDGNEVDGSKGIEPVEGSASIAENAWLTEDQTVIENHSLTEDQSLTENVSLSENVSKDSSIIEVRSAKRRLQKTELERLKHRGKVAEDYVRGVEHKQLAAVEKNPCWFTDKGFVQIQKETSLSEARSKSLGVPNQSLGVNRNPTRTKDVSNDIYPPNDDVKQSEGAQRSAGKEMDFNRHLETMRQQENDAETVCQWIYKLTNREAFEEDHLCVAMLKASDTLLDLLDLLKPGIWERVGASNVESKTKNDTKSKDSAKAPESSKNDRRQSDAGLKAKDTIGGSTIGASIAGASIKKPKIHRLGAKQTADLSFEGQARLKHMVMENLALFLQIVESPEFNVKRRELFNAVDVFEAVASLLESLDAEPPDEASFDATFEARLRGILQTFFALGRNIDEMYTQKQVSSRNSQGGTAESTRENDDVPNALQYTVPKGYFRLETGAKRLEASGKDESVFSSGSVRVTPTTPVCPEIVS